MREFERGLVRGTAIVSPLCAAINSFNGWWVTVLLWGILGVVSAFAWGKSAPRDIVLTKQKAQELALQLNASGYGNQVNDDDRRALYGLYNAVCRTTPIETVRAAMGHPDNAREQELVAALVVAEKQLGIGAK